MTEQQFNRACEISARMEALAKTKREIEETSKHRLYFAYKDCDGEFRLCPDWSMRPDAEVLELLNKINHELGR